MKFSKKGPFRIEAVLFATHACLQCPRVTAVMFSPAPSCWTRNQAVRRPARAAAQAFFLLIPYLFLEPLCCAAAVPGTGTPLSIVRGEVHRVSTLTELNTTLDTANRGGVAVTILLGDGTYVLDVPALDIRCP